MELGSTRIKTVLLGPDHFPLATGSHGWENSLVDGIWTYPLGEVWEGLQASFADLQNNIASRYGVRLRRLQAIGISGMMHGYLVFDAQGRQLAPFRTWRNNITGRSSEELSQLFQYPIPQRWSIAHLDQAILRREEHVGRIAQLTTLAGYVHWKLTGEKVVGIGEASGMFPIDLATGDFHAAMLERFDARIADNSWGWKVRELLPQVRRAGEPAGQLTREGAKLLDPTGCLEPGAAVCPPEGDAGTGMVATNSVEVRTGNVSAGTSVFAMIVLEKELSRLHPQIDLVATPDGKLVGMVHSNNCSSDLDAWIHLLGEAAAALGARFTTAELYQTLLPLALRGEPDGGGLLSYGYLSGEHLTGFEEGRPLFVRSTNGNFTLANFLRTHLLAALSALRIGLEVLMVEEGVVVEELRGHGGFFKTAVGARVMAAATRTPVSVLATAGEGGAWGIALLASYLVNKREGQTLPEFLRPIFAGSMGNAVQPDPTEVAGFDQFLARYRRGLAVERAAVQYLP